MRHAQERHGNPDSNLSLPQAVVLVATQVLLDRLVDNGRDRLRVVGSWAANAESAIGLWVVQGLGKKRMRILVPVQNGPYMTAIMSVLRVSSASGDCVVQPAGMAGKGAHEIDRWGASGQCEIRWPRTLVQSYLQALKFDAMSTDQKERTVLSYGETPHLVVDGEVHALPSLLQCGYIARALAGEDVVVSPQDLDAIEPFMACGIPLVSGPNPNQVGILDAYVLQLPQSRR